jgi:hypothetical protein
MVRFLLDEHLDPAIASGVRRCREDIAIVALARWENGAYLGASDELLLRAAHEAGWTLVTFDQRTIVSLLRAWGTAGIAHGGVVLLSSATFSSSDVGGMASALVSLWEQLGADDWTDRVVYLVRE